MRKAIEILKNREEHWKKPSIRKCKNKPYTQVTFKPDYMRFGLDGLTDDMYNLLKKRTYDIAAVTGRDVKVKFNGELLNIKCFEINLKFFVLQLLQKFL